VHDDEGNNGIMRVDLVSSQLPEELSLGFKEPYTGKVIKGVYICDQDGNYLISRIGLLNGEFYVRSEQWYKSHSAIRSQINPNYQMEINGKIVNVPMLTYYRASTELTGNLITAFLQKVESVIVPQDPYTPLFDTQIDARMSHRINLITEVNQFYLDSAKSDVLYGKDFDLNTVFRLYFELLDASKTTDSYISLYTPKFLDILNGILKQGVDEMYFEKGKDLNQINKNIKDLFLHSEGYFDWVELKRFVYKTSDGNFNIGMELKEWLDLIYQRIIAYSGDNIDIIKQKQLLETLAPLDVLSDREYFKDEEVIVGKVILASVQQLFGHAVVRLILMGMVDLNNDVSLRVMSRPRIIELFRILGHVGLVSPKSKFVQFENIDSPSTRYSKDHDLVFFAALFLDSHIAFKIAKGEYTKKVDSYILPIGPITLSNRLLSDNNPTHLSYLISAELANTYREIHGYYTHVEKGDIFIKSQQNLIKRFEELIISQVLSDPSIPINKKDALISKLISEIRKFFVTPQFYVKSQFYSFLDSGNAHGTYIFRNGYSLQYSIHDFEGLDIIRWAGLFDVYYGEEIKLSNIIHVEENVNNFINHFKDFVISIGGKIEIFPLHFLEGFGYKGMRGDLEFLFDSYSIDFTDATSESYRKSENLLRHMGYLMHAYPVAFVVKEAGSTWDTKKIINIFNFRGYLKKFDIYSASGTTGRIFKAEDYSYSLIFPDPDDPGNYISFYDDYWDSERPSSTTSYYSLYNQDWNTEIWLNTIGLESLRIESIFNSWYMNLIKTSTSEFARDIREILNL